MIEARGVSKSFGRLRVLESLSMQVADGEIVALMGPNGAGKTTLLRIMGTLTELSAGDVLIGGTSIHDDPVGARRTIGVVGHSTYTYDDLTALENLRFYWLMNGLPPAAFRNVGMDLLRRVGLAHRANDRAAVFSKGMRQRLAIARALINSPKVLLLDEPFSSLDEKGVEVLSQVLLEERAKGASILIVTHDVVRIATLADRADLLVAGRISRSFAGEAIRDGNLESSYRASSEGGIV